MRVSLHRLVSAALLLGLALSFQAIAAPRIGVMTMQPGEVFFERFGHNAIVVEDPDGGPTLSYNFGFFDPGEADFVGNFAKGIMQYYLVALPVEEDLAQYRAEGRGVSVQWLDLEPAQAQALAAALAERARPENARYRYDYFTANCSTMVRDMLDHATDGLLKSQLSGRSHGNTLRSEAVRLASPAPWMWIGFDLGLGPSADQPMSLWEEAYVPMRLAHSLDELKTRDGRPLVQSESELLPQRLPPEPAEPARSWKPWLLAGIVLAAGIVLLGRSRPRVLAGLALPLWLACGIGGLLISYIWGFTEHWAGWRNQNLLLLNPLCLLLVGCAISVLRRHKTAPWQRGLLWLVAGGALMAWFPHWLAIRPQFNQIWIALLLPVHVALAYVFTRPALRR